MAQEIETKILDVDEDVLARKLLELGAKKIQETKLTIDWYQPKGLIKDQQPPWFLRIRTSSEGKSEVTWKSWPKQVGIVKEVKEINFPVKSGQPVAELFEAIGLEKYAYQEKYRTSWQYEDWRFDLDRYPGVPAYLEIEGRDEQHLIQAIKLLGLENHRAVSEGERTLIQNEYRLDWYNMRF